MVHIRYIDNSNDFEFCRYASACRHRKEFQMQFGHFDDQQREYVITDPRTPLPWINYLGSEDFFTLLSNTAGGYCFYRDARLRRLTRYRYNNCPVDQEGFHIYIKDGKTVWNPGWQPTKTELDRYTCRHGLGYSVIEGQKNGVSAAQTLLVPQGENCLLIRLCLKNETDIKKTLDVFPYVEFCLWDAMDDGSNFQRNFSIGEVELEPDAIYHKSEYRERRNHYAVLWANRPYDGFDTARDAFIGPYGSPALPEAVAAGCCTGSIAHGWAPVGAMQFHMALRPGESRELFFGLGYVENPEDEKFSAPGVINKTRAHAMIGKYRTPAQFDAAMDALHGHWDTLLSNYHAETGDEKVDRMVNIWNQYQCMVTFNMSRSASYFESGMGRGMGFRDSCQDLLGFVHIIPERARERILDIAATQFADGSAYHQYQPLTKKGNLAVGSGFNDDPLWLIAGVDAYLRETGDWSILDEVVTFDCDPDNAAPLMEHLRRSFRFTCTHLGPHKLPLIGRADWNDCLNLNCFSAYPGESFQITGPSEGPVAESVFIAGMFVKYGRAYADILRHLALNAEAAAAETAVAEMEMAVLEAGWDGAWFRRAYDAFGAPVGSKDCKQQNNCRMIGQGKHFSHETFITSALGFVPLIINRKFNYHQIRKYTITHNIPFKPEHSQFRRSSTHTRLYQMHIVPISIGKVEHMPGLVRIRLRVNRSCPGSLRNRATDIGNCHIFPCLCTLYHIFYSTGVPKLHQRTLYHCTIVRRGYIYFCLFQYLWRFISVIQVKSYTDFCQLLRGFKFQTNLSRFIVILSPVHVF